MTISYSDRLSRATPGGAGSRRALAGAPLLAERLVGAVAGRFGVFEGPRRPLPRDLDILRDLGREAGDIDETDPVV